MDLLKIIKLSTKTWKHNSNIDGDFILTKFYAKQENTDFLLVESYGAKRRKYKINEIEVYNIGGTAETFTNFEDLFLRLEELNYPAFYVDGEFIFNPSNYDLEDFTNESLNPFVREDELNFLSNNPTTYPTATTPIADTDQLFVIQGGVVKKVDKSEIGGGGASNVKEILVDLYLLPSTGSVETIVATYNIADMVAQNGVITLDLRHGKNTYGGQEIFIYFSNSEFTFGTKIRRSGLLSSSSSSVGFSTMFYIKNNEISDNRSATASSYDDAIIGTNPIKTVIIPNASTMHFMHVVLSSSVNGNVIYGTIKNVK